MRSARFVSLLVLITLGRSAAAQQATASAPQATALLQQSLAALSGGRPLTDVILSGTARSIEGSDDESGTVVVKAIVGTGTRIDLTLPSGPRSEIRNTSALPLRGSWSGPDSVDHDLSNYNLMTDLGLFPTFSLAGFAVSQTGVATYVGLEIKNGNGVIHISAHQQSTGMTIQGASLQQHFTQVEFYLDPFTLLPVAMTFNTHPDNDALTDIPTEINFSDYRLVNGAQVPFHVQKFLNGSLTLEVQFSKVTTNTGLSASSFEVQQD